MTPTITTITIPIIKSTFSNPLKKLNLKIARLWYVMVGTIWGVLTFGAHYPKRRVKNPDSTRGS